MFLVIFILIWPGSDGADPYCENGELEIGPSTEDWDYCFASDCTQHGGSGCLKAGGCCCKGHFTNNGCGDRWCASNNAPCRLPRTPEPTPMPTTKPTNPTRAPSTNPTENPSTNPTQNPSSNPTLGPTLHPTIPPSSHPTKQPTSDPLVSLNPTLNPSANPSFHPVTSLNPTFNPSANPSSNPVSLTVITTDSDEVTRYVEGEQRDKEGQMGEATSLTVIINYVLVGMALLICCMLGCCIYLAFDYQQRKKMVEAHIAISEARLAGVAESERPKQQNVNSNAAAPAANLMQNNNNNHVFDMNAMYGGMGRSSAMSAPGPMHGGMGRPAAMSAPGPMWS